MTRLVEENVRNPQENCTRGGWVSNGCSEKVVELKKQKREIKSGVKIFINNKQNMGQGRSNHMAIQLIGDTLKDRGARVQQQQIQGFFGIYRAVF